MTEAEWLAWEAPGQMLNHLRRRISRRKLRHFIIEEHLPTYKFWHPAAEQEAGSNHQEVLAALSAWAESGIAIADVTTGNPAWLFLSGLERRIASRRGIAQFLWDWDWVCAYRLAKAAPLKRVQLRRTGRLLAEIAGNPFRPVSFSPEWRTTTAVAIASQMYESRDFSAMPILADALQDAGCDNADVLTHCRAAKGTHVRGCWVVDLVLGKE